MEDDLNTEIQELALLAKRHPSGSRERRKAITKLHQLMIRDGVLHYPPMRGLPAPLHQERYRDLYEQMRHDSLSNVFAKIDTMIDTYDRSRAPFVGYVQRFVGWRFSDQVPRYQYLIDEYEYQRHNKPNSDVQRSCSLSKFDMLCQYIEEDPEGLLKEKRMRAYPQVTLQAVMVRHIILRQTYQEIATALGVTSHSTVSTFYYRELEKIIPQIRAYWQNHGSEMD